MPVPQQSVVTSTLITADDQALSAMEMGEDAPKRLKTASQLKATLSNAGNPLSGADAALLDLLAQWDTNGDGQYSVEEVLLIARHFQQKQRQVTNLKRTLCLGSVFTLVLLVGILFVCLKANEMTKDMRPSNNGVLTTNNGKVAGVAQVLQQGDLDNIPNMTDDQLAELQFVSFNLNQDHYVLKVAGAVREHTEVQGEHGPRSMIGIFFVNGPFASMNFGRDISMVHRNGTSEVLAVGAAGEQRRLQSLASAPWAHIGQKSGVGIVGLSGVASAPWAHIGSAPWAHIGR